MSIRFEIDPTGGWVYSYWTGEVTDEEIVERYVDFLGDVELASTVHELSDVSDADLRLVTVDGIAELAELTEAAYIDAGVNSYKTAVYSPNDLPFGLARVYEAHTANSPESVQVFRDRQEALRWLTD